MNSDDVKVFYDLLKDDNYCLLYNGNFVDAVTSKIINITKVSLIQRGELIKTQNRFSYLIAECFQNVIRHGGHKEHDINDKPLPGFFMAKIKNGYYDLSAGNLIQNENIPRLKKQFDDVNVLSYDELKDLYKKALAEGQLSAKGGAGLGLIDMAKKSAQELEYKFLKHNDSNSMFYHRVVMTSYSDINERKGSDHNIEFGIDIHNTMMERNILMLQKSDFSRGSILPMLQIVEKNIETDANDTKLVEVSYQALIELVQYINQQGFLIEGRKEGLFFISRKEDEYNICLGNCVDNKKLSHLKEVVGNINSMNKKELEKLIFKDMDRSNAKSIDESAIDISWLVSEKFHLNIHDVDSEASFLSICATI